MIQFGKGVEPNLNNSTSNTFDDFSSNRFCMLKAFSCFLDNQTRCRIACLIKILELKQCFHALEETQKGTQVFEKKEFSLENLLHTLKEELPKEQQESIRQMEEMMETMQLYQEMMSMKEDD